MVWARISTLGCISRHLDEDVLHALAREVVLEHRVDLWRRWHTRPEHAPALRDLARSSATMQSAHPCARKRPASAGGSTSRPPPQTAVAAPGETGAGNPSKTFHSFSFKRNTVLTHLFVSPERPGLH